MTRKARSGERSAFTPSDTMRSASMSRPESVSSRMQKDGWSRAICRISMRFFSPPEKPTLRARLSISRGISSCAADALTRLMKSGVVSSDSPRARLHVEDVLAVEQDLAVEDLVVLLAGDDVGERRLAGPVGAHDGRHLAPVHGEIHAIENA